VAGEGRAGKPLGHDVITAAQRGLQAQVVAEPASQLMGVGDAAHPGEQRDVEGHSLLPSGQPGRGSQPPGQHSLAEQVLLRLTKPQIGSQ
jgi:hypothetical protein